MLNLDGRVIAITEARRAKEMAEHIAKLGGVAVVVPAVREVLSEDQAEVQAAVRRICGGEVHWAIFLTGVGARAVVRTTEGMGCRDAFIGSLNRMLVAARGPKSIGVLREAGIRVDVVPPDTRPAQ
ncbi:MAG TPA: uroporphyrinogen-III synthase [Candidatus Methylomirabilis sp.]|nr:uroporphyrinogen-III synthase [Candidatus Methylomirabilis sp.]